MTGGQRGDQTPSHTAPPKCRIYSQIQQLAFILGHTPRHRETRDAPVAQRHQEVVP